MNATVTSASAVASAQLAVSGLGVRFGPLTALDSIDLMVRSGELVALAGENGAGKSTLVRCIAGDIAPTSGAIVLDGRPVPADPIGAKRRGISVVWQDLSLCENLDVASNVLLGRERRGQLLSDTRLRTDAARIFERLGVPLHDPERSVRALSGGQRQMVAVARAMVHQPRLLLLDEPTASLGVQESGLVEELIMRVREQGTTVLLACHDTAQMFRLADRIVVLRQGRVIAEVSPSEVHPDDVVALVSGQEVDSSARRQLIRLHGLTGRLVLADPSSSLSLILSALGAALGSERLCIHLLEDTSLVCAASLGLAPRLVHAWSRLPCGPAGGPVGLAAAGQAPVVEENVQAGTTWGPFTELARSAKVASSWSVPVLGPGGLLGVITVFRATAGPPRRDDLDLASLYAGYVASAVDRDRLLVQVTARNRVLETIREMLQILAGPVPVAEGLDAALQALRRGLKPARSRCWPSRRPGRPAAAPRRARRIRRAQPLRRARPSRRVGAAPSAPRRCGTRRRPRWPRRGTTARRCTPPPRCAPRQAASPGHLGRPAAPSTCCRWPFRRRAAGPRWSPGGAGCRHRTRPRCSRTPRTRCGWRWNGKRPGRPSRRRRRCAGPGSCSAASCPG